MQHPVQPGRSGYDRSYSFGAGPARLRLHRPVVRRGANALLQRGPRPHGLGKPAHLPELRGVGGWRLRLRPDRLPYLCRRRRHRRLPVKRRYAAGRGNPNQYHCRADTHEVAPQFYLDDCAAIAYEPMSGHADPSGTAAAYASRARELGAQAKLQAAFTGVEISASGKVVAVTTADERIETETAVVATGPWSRRFLLRHGIDLPLEATRHEVVHFKRPLEKLPNHPGGGDIANLIYFRPEGTDLTLVGNGNIEEVVDDPEIYAPRPSQSSIQEVWGRLVRRIPVMEEAEYSTGYAGLYTSAPDSHPVIDRVENIEGLYVCTGFSGHGFKLSPW